MSFFLFLAVTATLFLRPGEIVADLEGLPIYEWLILSCLVASILDVIPLLSRDALVRQPITLAVLGMLTAVFMSHASYGNLWSARYHAFEFAKIVIYYVLLLANVNSAARLRTFFFWLLGCITFSAVLAVLQFNEVIDIPSLAAVKESVVDPETGEVVGEISRMCSTGIFHDPNDLSMLLVLGTVMALYFFFDPRIIQLKLVMAGAIVLFLYALVLTRSRGGFLAFLAAFWVLFQSRHGWRKAALLGALFLPLALVLIKGRQADVGGAVTSGTGQSRIQLWSAGMGMLRQSPFFGIGHGYYTEYAENVAHNSYLHAFSELGLFGGVIFLGACYYALRSLYLLGRGGVCFADPELARLRPYLLSAIAGYYTAMLTLSRMDVVPTYLVLGLPAAYLGQVRTQPPLAGLEMSGKLVKDVLKVSVAFLAATYVFIRVFARWSE